MHYGLGSGQMGKLLARCRRHGRWRHLDFQVVILARELCFQVALENLILDQKSLDSDAANLQCHGVSIRVC